MALYSFSVVNVESLRLRLRCQDVVPLYSAFSPRALLDSLTVEVLSDSKHGQGWWTKNGGNVIVNPSPRLRPKLSRKIRKSRISLGSLIVARLSVRTLRLNKSRQLQRLGNPKFLPAAGLNFYFTLLVCVHECVKIHHH